MERLAEIVAQHAPTWIAVLTAGFALLVALCVSLLIRLRRMEGLWQRVRAASDDSAGAELVVQTAQQASQLADRMTAAEAQLGHLMRVLQGCVQHIGVVRYDAFEDVGGCQSFSLALLDGQRNGVVITAIYSRTDVRLYTKKMDHGRAVTQLTDEEAAAVKQAISGA